MDQEALTQPGSKPPETIQPEGTPATPTATVQPAPAPTAAVPAQQAAPAGTPPIDTAKKSRKIPIIAPIFAVMVLLGGIGAAAYSQLALNSPEDIWGRALKITSGGVKEFAQQATAEDQSSNFDIAGSFRVSEPTVIDGTTTGRIVGSSGELSSNVGFAGLRISTEYKAVEVEGADLPDLYLKADGLESVVALLGLSSGSEEISQLISEVNDQWYVVDHTLLETFQQQVDTATGADTSVQPNSEDVQEFIDESMKVLDDYLFSNSQDKGVFTIIESFEKEEFQGAEAYKYQIGVNKDNLKEFVSQYTSQVENTAYIMSLLDDGKTLAEELNIEDLMRSIDEADFTDATAEVWVDAERKFIRNVRFVYNKEAPESGYLDLYLPYDGGDVLPFTLRFVVDETKDPTATTSNTVGIADFVLGYNRSNKAIELGFDINLKDDTTTVVAVGDLSFTPSDNTTAISAPSGAKNVLELLNSSAVEALINSTQPGASTPLGGPGSDFDSEFDSFTPQPSLLGDSIELPLPQFEL